MTQDNKSKPSLSRKWDWRNIRIGCLVWIVVLTGLYLFEKAIKAPDHQEQVETAAAPRDCSHLRGRARYYNNDNFSGYLGCRGYLVGSFSTEGDEDITSPSWFVLADDGQTKLPHKTEVVVVEEQYEKAMSRGGFITGTLQICLPTGEIHSIPAYSFETVAYWELPPEKAVEHGPFIARYTGKGFPPANRVGKDIEVTPGTHHLIVGRSLLGGGYSGAKLEALMPVPGSEGKRFRGRWMQGSDELVQLFYANSVEIVY